MVPFGKCGLYYVDGKSGDFVPTFPPGDFLPSRLQKRMEIVSFALILSTPILNLRMGYIPILGQANLAAFVVIE